MSNEITTTELKGLISSVKIIDIRDNYQYNLGSIPTAVNIPMNFLLTNPDSYINKENKYYIYCEHGSRSRVTCSELKSNGYKVVNVIGGYSDYKLK